LHLPGAYELAFRSPVWHGAQHAFFFWTGILFCWPFIVPLPCKSPWPRLSAIPLLLFDEASIQILKRVFHR